MSCEDFTGVFTYRELCEWLDAHANDVVDLNVSGSLALNRYVVRCRIPCEGFGDDEEENGLMTSDRFNSLLDELEGASLETLKTKNAKYSKDGDALHNFRAGADVAGGTTAQACWGYLTKHIVALRDMVEKNDFRNREDFLEKCQDSINYIRFLWCIGNEEADKYVHEMKESN